MLTQLNNISTVSYCIQTVFVTVHYSPYFNPHFQSIRTINVTV